MSACAFIENVFHSVVSMMSIFLANQQHLKYEVEKWSQSGSASSLAPPQLIFEKEGVYLHTNAKRVHQDTTLPGFIRIVERVRSPVAPRRHRTREEVQSLVTTCLFQAGVPALEWSPLEDKGRCAPAVLYSKKVSDVC